nr:hypothetical protein [Agromyces laixinhei]
MPHAIRGRGRAALRIHRRICNQEVASRALSQCDGRTERIPDGLPTFPNDRSDWFHGSKLTLDIGIKPSEVAAVHTLQELALNAFHRDVWRRRIECIANADDQVRALLLEEITTDQSNEGFGRAILRLNGSRPGAPPAVQDGNQDDDKGDPTLVFE